MPSDSPTVRTAAPSSVAKSASIVHATASPSPARRRPPPVAAAIASVAAIAAVVPSSRSRPRIQGPVASEATSAPRVPAALTAPTVRPEVASPESARRARIGGIVPSARKAGAYARATAKATRTANGPAERTIAPWIVAPAQSETPTSSEAARKTLPSARRGSGPEASLPPSSPPTESPASTTAKTAVQASRLGPASIAVRRAATISSPRVAAPVTTARSRRCGRDHRGTPRAGS